MPTVKGLAERDHVRTADKVAHQPQVGIAFSPAQRSDDVRASSSPVTEGPNWGVLTMSRKRWDEELHDEFSPSHRRHSQTNVSFVWEITWRDNQQNEISFSEFTATKVYGSPTFDRIVIAKSPSTLD